MEGKCSLGWRLKVEEFEKGSCDQEVGIQRLKGESGGERVRHPHPNSVELQN